MEGRVTRTTGADGALTLKFMLAARQRELQGMDELAQTCELVIAVGRLVHALQKERGQATLRLGLRAQVDPGAWQAQVALATAVECGLRDMLAAGLTEARMPRLRPRWLNAVARGLHSLDGLDALRQDVAQGAVGTDHAVAAYSRTIGSLLGIAIEALEGAADPQIGRLLVALLNFMQAKELCGQERACGVACFAAGRFDAERKRLMSSLAQAQARSFELFCQHAPESLREAWTALQADGVALARLRRMGLDGDVDGPLLDAGLAQIWFDVCTAHIDALYELETALTLHLAACCRQAVAEADGVLADLDEQARQYQDLSMNLGDSLVYTLVGQPVDAAVTGDAIGEGVARSVLDVLLAQGARLHAADMALDQARRAQQERRRIEQAKWWLVSRHGLTEADAHERLQRTAMNTGLSLHGVADQILQGSEVGRSPRAR